jgi:serine/threonine-protein kinase
MGPHLDEALELDTAAREVWLNELHARSPLLAAQIREYLQELAELEKRDFLGVTPATILMSTQLEGHTLGAYTLDRMLGQGGMGTVWLAHRSDGQFEGQAAVKLLHATFGRQPAEKRFAREASVLAKLHHPNIAQLRDAGVDEGGQPYLILEYVEGDRIDRYCERHALSVEQRIRLFRDVLSAVAHAHSNLIVHRDLKPSNILVTEEGTVKLLDFGVAALLSEAATGATGSAAVVAPGLTPGYAAPEQLLNQPVTTATDVYALGLVLFVLLAGRHPAAPQQMKTSSELVRFTLETQAPRLSEVVADSRQARLLQGDLEAIVTKAIDREPLRRYRTAELFAQDLQHYLAVEPVAARPRSFGYQFGKFVRRNRGAVMSASVAILAIVVSGGFAVLQMIEANRQRSVAQDQAARAETTRDFLEFVLSDAGASGKPFTTAELLARAETTFRAQYGAADTVAALEQLTELAVLNIDLGQHKKAQELLETVYRRAATLPHTDLRWMAACELARLHHYAGQMHEADVLFEKTIRDIRRQAPDSLVLVECLQHESDLRLTEEDIPAGLARAHEAVELADQVYVGSPLRQVGPRIQLATAYRLAGDLGPADSLYRDILGSLRGLGRERTADAVNIYSSWAAVKSDAGDILGALQLIGSAIEVGRALRPGELPDQIVAVNYAKRLVVLNRPREAEPYLTGARETAAAEGDLDLQAIPLLSMISAKRAGGDLLAAQQALTEAQTFVTAHFPPAHPAQRSLLLETGMLRLADGSLTQAQAALLQASAEYSRSHSRVTNEVQAFGALAEVEIGLGDLQAAATHAAQTRALASKFAIAGQPSYWVGYGLLVQAKVDAALHRLPSSDDFAARAVSQLAPTVGKDHPLTRQAAALTGH